MFQKLAEINVDTHTVQVGRTGRGNITVFKCDVNHCDWDLFDSAHAASDYLIERLPTEYLRVTFGDDDEEWHPIVCKAYP
jgi:hypothetical protein